VEAVAVEEEAVAATVAVVEEEVAAVAVIKAEGTAAECGAAGAPILARGLVLPIRTSVDNTPPAIAEPILDK
jgi:hypothetical protein